MSLENRGNTGAPLNATNNGLVLVDEDVWFPGTAGNDLVSDDATPIPSTLGVLGLPWTSGPLTILATDLPADVAATSFTASTGQIITVNRGTSGPVTVLAPQPVLVNPDNLVLTNNLSIPDDPAWTIPADEDAIGIWVGQIGNTPDAQGVLLKAGQGAPGMRVNRLDFGSTPLDANVNDGSTNVNSQTGGPTWGNNNPVMVACILNRTTDLVYVRVYDATGIVESTAGSDSSALGLIDPSSFTTLTSLPGTFSAATFRKGVGIAPTDTDLAIMADYLLTATA